MRTLSILQPYAWPIVTGRKDIENRTWATSFRGRILVHAGKKYGKRDYADDADQYGDEYPEREAMIGCIVGEVTIVDCVRQSGSRWFNGPFGFVLADAVAYETPIPFRGQLGFFDVPLATIDLARREMAES